MGDQETMSFAKVRLVSGKMLLLPVSGADKPVIPQLLMDKWQRTVDLAAKALHVPAGLITRLTTLNLDVLVASRSTGNPFSASDSLPLGIGMYCETTTGTRDKLQVTNALKDEAWKKNPSVDFDLIAYLGMPIVWPDGEVFGTICMLDSREHHFKATQVELLDHFKSTIEADMSMLLEREQLRAMNVEKEFALQEAHHRIKNHLNMIASIIQLKAAEGVNPEEMEAFMKDLGSRIRAISEMHSQIAEIGITDMDLAEFARRISETVVSSIAGAEVSLRFSLEPVRVGREACFHVGLLLNELITNSLKHAFAGVERPEIAVELKGRDERSFILRYRDNGVGLPGDQDLHAGNSLGMHIIFNVPERMGGSFTINRENGTGFEFILCRLWDRDGPLGCTGQQSS